MNSNEDLPQGKGPTSRDETPHNFAESESESPPESATDSACAPPPNVWHDEVDARILAHRQAYFSPSMQQACLRLRRAISRLLHRLKTTLI